MQRAPVRALIIPLDTRTSRRPHPRATYGSRRTASQITPGGPRPPQARPAGGAPGRNHGGTSPAVRQGARPAFRRHEARRPSVRSYQILGGGGNKPPSNSHKHKFSNSRWMGSTSPLALFHWGHGNSPEPNLGYPLGVSIPPYVPTNCSHFPR